MPGRHVIGAASRVRGCTPSGAAYGLPPSTVAVRPWSAPRAGRGGSEPGLRRRGRETAVRAWTARVRCLPYAVSRRGGGWSSAVSSAALTSRWPLPWPSARRLWGRCRVGVLAGVRPACGGPLGPHVPVRYTASRDVTGGGAFRGSVVPAPRRRRVAPALRRGAREATSARIFRGRARAPVPARAVVPPWPLSRLPRRAGARPVAGGAVEPRSGREPRGFVAHRRRRRSWRRAGVGSGRRCRGRASRLWCPSATAAVGSGCRRTGRGHPGWARAVVPRRHGGHSNIRASRVSLRPW